jgi:small subunit ribosomal protein S4
MGPLANAQHLVAQRPIPDWLSLDAGALSGSVTRFPERTEMEQLIEEQLIVEYYSR